MDHEPLLVAALLVAVCYECATLLRGRSIFEVLDFRSD